MNFNVVDGDRECEALFRELSDYEVKSIVTKIGEIVEKEMKARIARDTGNAHDSVKPYPKKLGPSCWDVHIYPSTRYYYYQEVGTSKDKKHVGKLLGAIIDTKQKCFDVAREYVTKR